MRVHPFCSWKFSRTGSMDDRDRRARSPAIHQALSTSFAGLCIRHRTAQYLREPRHSKEITGDFTITTSSHRKKSSHSHPVDTYPARRDDSLFLDPADLGIIGISLMHYDGKLRLAVSCDLRSLRKIGNSRRQKHRTRHSPARLCTCPLLPEFRDESPS
jgi:hypothetical protein